MPESYVVNFLKELEQNSQDVVIDYLEFYNNYLADDELKKYENLEQISKI